jgi:medium-chain acyl-[acyl-carrier-protein] hydrolase
MALDRVFPFRTAAPSRRVRLFCLPFAGGNAGLYRAWQAAMPPDIEVCPVELPGRGLRFREPASDSMDALCMALAPAIEALEQVPCALFGHSMGARIAFELSKRLSTRIVHLFVSASAPPDASMDCKLAHLTDEMFMRALRKLGGTPTEVLANQELMELALPTLRADFRLLERYAARAGERAPCSITAIAADDDPRLTLESAGAWAPFSGGDFRLVKVSGGHFFLDSAREIVVHEIVRVLEPLLANRRSAS